MKRSRLSPNEHNFPTAFSCYIAGNTALGCPALDRYSFLTQRPIPLSMFVPRDLSKTPSTWIQRLRQEKHHLLPIFQKPNPLRRLACEIYGMAGEEEIVFWCDGHRIARKGPGVDCQSGRHAAGDASSPIESVGFTMLGRSSSRGL